MNGLHKLSTEVFGKTSKPLRIKALNMVQECTRKQKKTSKHILHFLLHITNSINKKVKFSEDF